MLSIIKTKIWNFYHFSVNSFFNGGGWEICYYDLLVMAYKLTRDKRNKVHSDNYAEKNERVRPDVKKEIGN